MDNLTLTLKMSIADTNKVLAGLGHLPFKDCADLIASIKQQGDAQLAAHLAEQSKAESEAANDGGAE